MWTVRYVSDDEVGVVPWQTPSETGHVAAAIIPGPAKCMCVVRIQEVCMQTTTEGTEGSKLVNLL